MHLTLNIYTDETLTDVKRVAEAEQVKIPYRVSMSLIGLLESTDIKNESDLMRFIGTLASDKMDKVVKATFGVSETELDCINGVELVTVFVDLFKWAMDKVKELKGNSSKNA